MKRGLITLIILFTSLSLFAQEEQKVAEKVNHGPFLTNKLFDNWFISAGIGTQYYIGEYDSKESFAKRLTPAFDFSVGKWFTPYVGSRIQFAGFNAKGLGKSTAPYIEGSALSNGLYKEKFNIVNVHWDFLWNLSSRLFGYKADRVYELVPYLGIGYAHAWKSGVEYKKDEVAINAGLINKFRLSDAMDFNLELRSMLIHERFQGTYGGIRGNGMLSATVGFTYKFKRRGFDKYVEPIPADYSPYNKKISELEGMLGDKERANSNLKKELQAERNKPKEVVAKPEAMIPNIAIFFDLGKSQLSDKAMVNLANIALILNKVPEKKFTIVGTADKETGSKKFNQALSEKRAKAVYDVLVNKFGVNPSQLEISARGAEYQPFGKPYLNRVAIIEN